MNATQKENLNLELEKFVDSYGLLAVMQALAQIAHEKSAHIAENWQDTALAKIWSKRGSAIGDVVDTFDENI